MAKVEITQLIEAGAHFGHLTRRWNPKMRPYIFMERNGIHIIDLKKSQKAIEDTVKQVYNIVSTGKRVLFVGTKKQAKSAIASEAKRSDSNWVSERWLGGMLTNFSTIRKSIKRLQNIEKMESDGTFEKITKKERLFLSRERDKLRKVLDGVETLNKMPGIVFIVDIKKESIAVKEAQKLNIPIAAIVDTNCDPDEVNFVIPGNDDASRTIDLVCKVIADAAIEGSLKAKELKAEETAEKERLKKERGEEEPKVARPKRKVGKPFKAKKDEKTEVEKMTVTPTAEEKKKEVKETPKKKEEVKETPEKKEEVKETPEKKEEVKETPKKKETPSEEKAESKEADKKEDK